MDVPNASIVIPLLNQIEAWLRESVSSALNQTAPCEVLVVTSSRTCASNLNVLEGLRFQYGNLKVLCQEPETGFAAALNLGIRRASANRIGFLLSDDWLELNAVETCLGYTAAIVSTGKTIFAADGHTALTELAQVYTPKAYNALRTSAGRATFLGHFFLFQREALESAGGIDETLGDTPGVDDFDLIWCLLEAGASVSIVPQSLYNYRDHDGERLTRRGREAMLATFNRILDKHGLYGRERQRILREHSHWFGLSMSARYRELAPQGDHGPVFRQVQSLYRNTVPLGTRLSIHERFLKRLASSR